MSGRRTGSWNAGTPTGRSCCDPEYAPGRRRSPAAPRTILGGLRDGEVVEVGVVALRVVSGHREHLDVLVPRGVRRPGDPGPAIRPGGHEDRRATVERVP